MGIQIKHSYRFRVNTCMIVKDSNHHSDLEENGQGQIVLKSVLMFVRVVRSRHRSGINTNK